MPKGQNADGSPKKRPVNSGIPKKPGSKMVSKRLAGDVIDILAKQPNQTDYIETAIREKHEREK